MSLHVKQFNAVLGSLREQAGITHALVHRYVDAKVEIDQLTTKLGAAALKKAEGEVTERIKDGRWAGSKPKASAPRPAAVSIPTTNAEIATLRAKVAALESKAQSAPASEPKSRLQQLGEQCEARFGANDTEIFASKFTNEAALERGLAEALRLGHLAISGLERTEFAFAKQHAEAIARQQSKANPAVAGLTGIAKTEAVFKQQLDRRKK
jgi:hypothetical protein